MAHDASMSASRAARSLALVLLTWLACIVAVAGSSDPPGRVAQVNLVEGKGSMQVSGTTDWSSELLYRPLATGDRVWIDSGARAEMHVGSTVLRLGSRTELQVLAVDDQNVRLAVIAGSVVMRVRSLDADEHYELSTPAGDVAILQPGVYRLDVDENERRAYLAVRSGWAEITARSDTGTLHIDDAAEFMADDTPSIRGVRMRSGDSLDHWADDRDVHEDDSQAAAYVPREVVGYQDLDAYGDWYVDPVYGAMWMPVVASGWAPYRYGYWSWIGPWGWTWVPAEPWGFATCHYGRWVQVRHGWAWAPGPRNRQHPVFAPALVNWSHDHPPELYARGTHAPPVGMAPLRYNEVYSPPFQASPQYVRAENLSNTHLRHGEVERFIDERQRHPAPSPWQVQQPIASPAQPIVTPARPVVTPARPVVTPAPRPVMRTDPAPVHRDSSPADRPTSSPPRVIMAPVGAPPGTISAPPASISAPPASISAPPASHPPGQASRQDRQP